MQITHTIFINPSQRLADYRFFKRFECEAIDSSENAALTTVEFTYPEGTVALQLGFLVGDLERSLQGRVIEKIENTPNRKVTLVVANRNEDWSLYVYILLKEESVPAFPISVTTGSCGGKPLPEYQLLTLESVSTIQSVSLEEAFCDPKTIVIPFADGILGIQIDYPDLTNKAVFVEAKIEGKSLVVKFACWAVHEWKLNIYGKMATPGNGSVCAIL